MGRNKFSQTEIIQIAKLLRLKNAGNRAQQKQVRHEPESITSSISLTSTSLAVLLAKTNCRPRSTVVPFRYSTTPLLPT